MSSERDTAVALHASTCVAGTVLIGGVASGNTIREAVYGADWVDTYEAADDDPVRLELIPDPDPVPDPIVETEVVARIQEVVDLSEEWDCIVIDVDDDDVEQDAAMLANFATIYTTVEGRVVTVTRNRSLTIPGFRSTVVAEGDDFVTIVHQRWDPGGGIGTDSYSGKVRMTGKGWVTTGDDATAMDTLTHDGDVLTHNGNSLRRSV